MLPLISAILEQRQIIHWAGVSGGEALGSTGYTILFPLTGILLIELILRSIPSFTAVCNLYLKVGSCPKT